jgi:aromatic-L-amino-acid decarboxylase
VFALTPEYLRGDASGDNTRTPGDAAAIDYMDYGIQLGRRFRALKAWMALRAFGREGMESRIREHCRLAASLAERIERTPDFTLAAPVSMSVVCFRFDPGTLDAEACDRLNEDIVAAVNASGDAYLTHTRLRDRTAMRIGFGNVLTTERHVEQVWGRVVKESTRLSALG